MRFFRVKPICTWLTVVASVSVFALVQAPQLPAKLQEGQSCAGKGQFLKGWKLMKEALAEAKTDDEKSMVYGVLSQFAPFVGDVKAARQYEADGNPNRKEAPLPDSSPLEKLNRIDAIKAIVEASKGRRLVILNEEHDSTQCRAFGLQVALALRKEGFEYMAIETLSENLNDSLKLGYPIQSIGWYTKDPFYGDLVRQTMKAGYKMVEYETRNLGVQGDSFDRINAREIDQATHLIDRVLNKDPNARLFVYVGYSHATENWQTLDDGREVAWMAARIKRTTGIDPLTIDQTTMSERATPAYENIDYRFADSKGWIKQPVILRSKDGQWYVGGNYKERIDMQVFHPRSKFVHGRADWMRMGGYRHEVPLKPEWLPESGEVLVQAFVAAEHQDPIAMDQFIVRSGDAIPVMLLPTGEYRIVIQDENGDSKEQGSIKVK